MNKLIHADSTQYLNEIPSESIDMIYTDPPFGTGANQIIARKIAGKIISKKGYSDKHSDYLDFMVGIVGDLNRVLKPTGTMYLHLDQRWVHYVKIICDDIFGYDNFLSEIIWAYDFGGRGKRKWPAKHDTILMYAKDSNKHIFNWDEIEKIPYMAPGLQKDKSKAEDGKVPTDVWWMSIVGTASKERVGYPNQKPVKLIKRAIEASSNVGDVVLDPFGGSGSTAVAAHELGRQFITIDKNIEAIEVMQKRFETLNVNNEYVNATI